MLNVEALTSWETASVPTGKHLWMVPLTFFFLSFVLLIRSFHISSNYNKARSRGSVCYLQFHHIYNKSYVPSFVLIDAGLINYILFYDVHVQLDPIIHLSSNILTLFVVNVNEVFK